MLTTWSETQSSDLPFPEYPRPQMVRSQWVNLNGVWQAAFSKSEFRPDAFDLSITVPFSPESSLSGVNRILQPDLFLWYRRTFLYHCPQPEADGRSPRTLLHFGAVDQCASVWLNGVLLGDHTGGYLPFSFDCTDLLSDGINELLVRVTDVTDTAWHSRGKQSLHPGGIWYTPQSGIWQTVWMETVPADFIRSLHITPQFDASAVEITVKAESSDLPCTIYLEDGRVIKGASNQPIRILMPNFQPWSPEQPFLYGCEITLGSDRVSGYFAMRKFSTGLDSAGVPRLFLNNRPYFHNGVLDQGYWPDGLYTAPTDAAMVDDILLMKRMGFNMLRKHIKIEPLRWYYHCDRLGMLVWQDMINGGGRYRPFSISAPLVLGNRHRDSDYSYFSRQDAEGRAQYRHELEGMIRHLYNCPCIAMWVPFNEGWGQFDATEAVQQIRALDVTRTIDHASGWHDQGAGDVRSLHVYFKAYHFRRDRRGRAVVLSEFGGYSHRVPNHCFSEQEFGYKRLKTPGRLLSSYARLYLKQIVPAITHGLSAAVYTQLSDVEQETNGFITYDRKVVKLPEGAVRSLNNRLMEAFFRVSHM